MPDSDDVKGKVIRLMAEAVNDKPVATRRRAKPSQSQQARGDNNVQIQAAGDVNINTRRIVRPKVQPPPGSLSPAQAKRLQGAIDKLVKIEAAGGVLNGNVSRLYAKWYKILKDRFDVPSYHFIRAELADDALAWLKQVAAMNRPKLRRADNASWRNEHYTAIYARARELGMSKGDVYSLVLERIGKRVLSLRALGEQDLRRLYEIIMARRPG